MEERPLLSHSINTIEVVHSGRHPSLVSSLDVDTRAPGHEVLDEGMDQANIPTFLGLGSL